MTLTEKTIESSDLVAVGCNLLAIDRFERLPLFQVDSPSELVFQRHLAVLEYIQGSTVLEEEHFLGAGRCRVTSERWGLNSFNRIYLYLCYYFQNGEIRKHR